MKTKLSGSKVSRIISFAMALIVMCSLSLNSLAATVQNAGAAPASTGEFTPKEVAGEYTAPNNSFDDDNPKYYLITHDAAKAADTKVTFRGTDYELAGVAVVAESFDFNSLEVTEAGGQKARILAYNGPTDITVFFDDGRYNDTNGTNYTAYDRENTSYVGLTDVDVSGGGEPKVILSRNASSGTMQRNILNKKNIYFENVTFDGKGINMVDGSRGRGLIHVGSGNVDGLVMKNVIIENVGSSNFYSWTDFSDHNNVALKFYNALGQTNFENILIRNVKTYSGHSAVLLEEVGNVNFRNLTVDASAAYSTCYPIEVATAENHANASTALDDLGKQRVVFDGTLNITASNKCIYVERYQYDEVVVPAGDWYANWKTSNGSESSPAFIMYPSYAQTKNTSIDAIHDLADNYWIIDLDRYTGTDKSGFINTQLETILKVMDYTKENVAEPDYALDVSDFYKDTPRAPRANIKIVTAGNIPGFTVPDGYAAYDTNIVAVNSYTDQYDSTDLVPVADAATISFPTSNNIKLYNFDFHANAGYTKREAISGVVPLAHLSDTLDGKGVAGYPDYADYSAAAAPKVTNSTENSFINCNFTVLAKTLEIINTSSANGVAIGKTLDLNNSFTAGYTYNDDVDSEEIDNTDVMWYSSDPTVATVDGNGVVTAIAEGEVTIYLKALDSNNNGEVEKPFDAIGLRIFDVGNLSVSKTVTGTDADTTKDFTFTVTLSDKTINGTYGDMSFENGVATFTLKDGESKTATELPADITYAVAESDNEGYTVTKTNDTGTIVAKETATVSFNNHKDIENDITVTVKKVWQVENGSTHPLSVLVQLYKDGEAYGDAVMLSADNNWQVEWNELGSDFKWTVDELSVPDGYTKTVSSTANDWTITNTDAAVLGTTNLPDTGDTVNTALWIALLFISGSAATILGIAQSRKKAK